MMAKGEDNSLTFESKIKEIDFEIQKRKSRWRLTSLSWMDFDDISQILRIHIYKKWHLYDPSKPLAPWLNRIISNQIKNLVRNHYGNYARPCLKCAAAESDNLCSIYGSQGSDCPLYVNWERTKKVAHDLKVTLPIDNHYREVVGRESQQNYGEESITKIHKKMQSILKPLEWKVYDFLYIKGYSEEKTAKLMGYKTSEKNRSPGYKQIKNIKKSIIEKVKKSLQNDEIDL
jgi:RNA polymerase sigma factor (sigma-70 family)